MLLELPTNWEFRDFGGGNRGLFALNEEAMHVVAPPAVRIQPDEEDVDLASWRHAIWTCQEGSEPVVSIDPPEKVTRMSATDVIRMLPANQHDYVRSVLARQLRLAAMHSAPDPGHGRDDRRAQRAGRVQSWTIAELADAFPEESWFVERDVDIEVPATVEEILDRMPAVRETQAEVRQHLAAVRDEHRAHLRHYVYMHRQETGIRTYCRYKLEGFRYSLLLKLMRRHERELVPELREGEELLREGRGEILDTTS
jgi:hypothetical protein